MDRRIRTLTAAAMLTAMSVVIGMFCKTYLNFNLGLFRITFENLPIIISGILFGPWVGLAVGVVSDLASYMLSPQQFSPNLIVTLGAASVGLVSGLISRYMIRKRGYRQIIAAGALAHLVGSMIIKPIGLFQFYQWLAFARIPLYLFLIAPLEIMLICLMYKNRAIRKIFDDYGVKRKNDMTYDEALEYIHSINWTFCKPGLERIGTLCERLGNPQDKLKFVHVVGTNGKGSFCSMLSSILCESGYRVGLYTSPYICSFNERMQINGHNISDEELIALVQHIRPIADSMEDKPTEFELITAIAFEYFYRSGCEIVVLEAGMGGRLDSTNIIKSSLLSVITGIALDHTAYLGDTVEAIAKEKAGIMKDGCPVLWGGTDERARDVIIAEAAAKNIPCHAVDYDRFYVSSATLSGSVFTYGSYRDMKISLLGMYQPRNACTVLSAVDILKPKLSRISESSVRSGLEKAVWHARFEIISHDPLVIFDGAHNPQGIASAVESIKTYFGKEKVYLFTGVLSDKDYEKIADDLSEVAERAFTVTPDNPRALSAKEYALTLSRHGIEAESGEDIQKTFEHAKACAKADGKPLICLGSLYLYSSLFNI